jgi:DNA-binding transcriptional regulator YiaG
MLIATWRFTAIAIFKSLKPDAMKNTKRKSASPRSSNSVDEFIGQRMRELRHVHNISQVELGRELGVSFQQIQKWA